MNDLKDVVLLSPIGVENLNGRIYTEVELQKAINTLEGRKVLLQRKYGISHYPDLSDTIGAVSQLRIQGSYMMGTAEFNPSASELAELVSSGILSIRPLFLGEIEEDKTITKITICYFALSNDPA